MAETVVVARQKLEAGALSEAEALCQQALALDADLADAWQVLGLCAQRRGEASAALDHMRRAVAVEPRSARRRLDLAQVAMECGAYYDAVAHLEAVVAGCGDVPMALHQLGRALLRLQQPGMACDRLERAVNADPQCVQSWSDLGEAYLQLGRFEAALAALHAGAKCSADDVEIHVRTARALLALGRPDQALAHLQDLESARLSAEPTKTMLSCLGDVHLDLGDLDQALSCHRRALKLAPEDAEVQWAAAQAELSAGDLRTGFRRLARHLPMARPPRLSGRGYRDAHFPTEPAVIDGGDDLGRAVLLARYLPLAATVGQELTLVCSPHHASLLARSLPQSIAIASHPDAEHKERVMIDLLQVPGLLDPDEIPPSLELVALPELEQAARLQLRQAGRINVGLCWQGDDAARERHQAMHLSRLLPLLMDPQLHCVSLQTGVAAEQVEALPPNFALQVPPGLSQDRSQPVEELVAAIAALDLVITVAGPVAHVAGALGKPTWVMLSNSPDALWGRTERAWYGGLRTFTQARRNDWSGPLREIRSALKHESTLGRFFPEQVREA